MSCAQEENKKTDISQKQVPSSEKSFQQLELLVFKLEQKLELWSSTKDQKKLIASFEIQDIKDCRLGKYQVLNQEQVIQFQSLNKNYPKTSASFTSYPAFASLNISSKAINPFSILLSEKDFAELKSKLALAENSTALVFPNDNRNGGKLQACYSCPHWMAEIYAQLELEIKAFPISQ